MGILKEINKKNELYNICPVCGHEGWCSTCVENDDVYIVCKRDQLHKDLFGLKYIKLTANKNSLYIVKDKNNDFTIRQNSYVLNSGTEKQSIRLKDSKLDLMYKSLLEQLSLKEVHREKLIKDGFNNDLIARFNIKSFPDYSEKPSRWQIACNLCKTYGDLTGLPGAFVKETEEKQYWSFAGSSGICFPITNIYGEIVMLQNRLDVIINGKYKVVSSGGGYYKAGCSPGSRIGVIVPPVIKDSFVFYITEGIKKAIIGSYLLGSVFITVQGVNAWSELLNKTDKGDNFLDLFTEKFNSKVGIVAYDNDKYKNEHVMNAQKELIIALKSKNIIPAVAEWDSWQGKGLDDMLNAGNKPMYFPI